MTLSMVVSGSVPLPQCSFLTEVRALSDDNTEHGGWLQVIAGRREQFGNLPSPPQEPLAPIHQSVWRICGILGEPFVLFCLICVLPRALPLSPVILP